MDECKCGVHLIIIEKAFRIDADFFDCGSQLFAETVIADFLESMDSTLQGAPPGLASNTGLPCSDIPFCVKSINSSPSAVTSNRFDIIIIPPRYVYIIRCLVNFMRDKSDFFALYADTA